MIVVIGSPVLRRAAGASEPRVAGLAGEVALAAAAAGRAVQVVGKVGDDDSGDALLVALAHGGVGHAAVLRDAANPTPVALEGSAPADETAEASPFGEDDGADALHAALPPGLPLEAADVQLALRYLTDFRVVVIAAPLDPPTLNAVFDAARFAGAHLIRLDHRGAGPADAHPSADEAPVGLEVTAFEPPAGAEPAFELMVGRYASGLDAGRNAGDAFAEATRAASWERAASS